MKLRPTTLIRLASTGAAGLALVQSLSAATVLTGSGQANNALLPSTHGSNAVGTPDIALNWSATDGRRWEAYNGWPNGDQVYQVDGPGTGYTGAATYSIEFTPSSATIAVTLTSIDLNDWAGPAMVSLQNTTFDWNVIGSVSGVLAAGTGVVVADGTVQTLNFGLQGLGGEAVTLSFTPTGGSGSYFAVDNLSFDQVVIPETSSALLAATGLGALALRRRRK